MPKNARNLEVSDKLKVLVYGKSGTGKTTFACSFPKPYVFDFDNGMLSQRGRDVDFDTFSNYQEFELRLNEIVKNCPYKTVVIDSLTTMQELLMDRLLSLSSRKVATKQEWLVLIETMKSLLVRLTHSPSIKNVVMIAHERTTQDQLSGEVLVEPVTYGKQTFSELLPLWFDECYRARVVRNKEGKPVYQMMVKPDIRYFARTRILPPDVDFFEWSINDNPYEKMVRMSGGGDAK